METPENKPRGPGELAEFLSTKDPVTLVGGQAVNLWALHYYERAVDLAPFVSRDVDLLGTRSTLEEVAELAQAKPQYFSLRPPTNAVGVVIARDSKGEPVLIEVLRYLHGIKEDELLEPSYTFEIGDKSVPVCVPGPVALLKAKVANAADLNQAGRQDERHIRILCRILPDYWRDLCRAVIEQKLEERQLVHYLESALKVTRSTKGKNVLGKLGISSKQMFAGLDTDHLQKVRSFVSKRLTRIG